MDDSKPVLLVSLDLSSAFNTIDHDILLHRLEHWLGITGICRSWFKSYLSQRKLRVKIDEEPSELKDLKYGVPPGLSVGAQTVYVIYVAPGGFGSTTWG